MSHESSILTWVEAHLQEQLSFLETLVSINSHTENIDGVNKIQDLLVAKLASLGFETQRSPVEGSGDIVFATNCAETEKGVLLSGHVDTVHPPSSPFQALQAVDGHLQGPGSLDMKGGLVVILWALEALRDLSMLSEIPLRVLLNPEEEIGSPRTRNEIWRVAEMSRAALVFEWGRTGNAIITRRKGIQGFEIHAHGKKAHSGNAHAEGRNAIEALSHAVIGAQRITDYERGITVSVNHVSGGSYSSTVPEAAVASCDVRVPSAKELADVRKQFTDLVESNPVEGTVLSIKEGSGMEPLEETLASLDLYYSYERAAASIGITISKVETPLGGVSDANIIASAGVPTIDGLGPLGDGAHTDNEFSERESFVQRTACLVVWLIDQRRKVG